MLFLDTSFLVEYEREYSAKTVGPATRFLRSRAKNEAVAVSIIAMGEFSEGFTPPSSAAAFLSGFVIVQLSRAIAYKAAAMQSALPQRLGENDAWIAATALVYDAELAGREAAFKRVPRLKYTPLKP